MSGQRAQHRRLEGTKLHFDRCGSRLGRRRTPLTARSATTSALIHPRAEVPALWIDLRSAIPIALIDVTPTAGSRSPRDVSHVGNRGSGLVGHRVGVTVDRWAGPIFIVRDRSAHKEVTVYGKPSCQPYRWSVTIRSSMVTTVRFTSARVPSCSVAGELLADVIFERVMGEPVMRLWRV